MSELNSAIEELLENSLEEKFPNGITVADLGETEDDLSETLILISLWSLIREQNRLLAWIGKSITKLG